MKPLVWKLTVPTPEEQAKFDAQLEYRKLADARRDERERTRRAELQHRAKAIDRALKAYRKFDDDDVTEIRIRTRFIQTDDARRRAPVSKGYSLNSEVESRPPMTQLVERKRNSLRLMMTMLFVARMEHAPGERFENHHPNINPKGTQESWLTLAGLRDDVPFEKRRGLRRMFNTALDGLAAHDLVALNGTAGKSGRYNEFALLTENGSGTPYTVPSDTIPRKAAIALSADFFRQGWHLVLTDHELVTLLAIIDRTGFLRNVERSGTVRDEGVDLKKEVRYRFYGLSDEAYRSVHMLDRLGLITVKDPMPNRSNPGKLTAVAIPLETEEEPETEEEKAESNQRVPYRLIYQPIPVFTPALETVLDTLAK